MKYIKKTIISGILVLSITGSLKAMQEAPEESTKKVLQQEISQFAKLQNRYQKEIIPFVQTILELTPLLKKIFSKNGIPQGTRKFELQIINQIKKIDADAILLQEVQEMLNKNIFPHFPTNYNTLINYKHKNKTRFILMLVLQGLPNLIERKFAKKEKLDTIIREKRRKWGKNLDTKRKIELQFPPFITISSKAKALKKAEKEAAKIEKEITFLSNKTKDIQISNIQKILDIKIWNEKIKLWYKTHEIEQIRSYLSSLGQVQKKSFKQIQKDPRSKISHLFEKKEKQRVKREIKKIRTSTLKKVKKEEEIARKIKNNIVQLNTKKEDIIINSETEKMLQDALWKKRRELGKTFEQIRNINSKWLIISSKEEKLQKIHDKIETFKRELVILGAEKTNLDEYLKSQPENFTNFMEIFLENYLPTMNPHLEKAAAIYQLITHKLEKQAARIREAQKSQEEEL